MPEYLSAAENLLVLWKVMDFLLWIFMYGLCVDLVFSAKELFQDDPKGKAKLMGYSTSIIFGVMIIIKCCCLFSGRPFQALRAYIKNRPIITFLLLPLLQSSLLVFSNIFTFLQITSIFMIFMTALFAVTLLRLEYDLYCAYQLNLTSTALSICMAMAVSCYAANLIIWEVVFVIWLLAVVISLAMDKVPVPLSS